MHPPRSPIFNSGNYAIIGFFVSIILLTVLAAYFLTPHGVKRAVILPGVNPECSLIPQSLGEVEAIVAKYSDFFIPFMNVDPRAVGNSPDADLSHIMRY